ncbi:MAG: 6-carboxytetrahydropterin synthase [Bacteroidales bacterium]
MSKIRLTKEFDFEVAHALHKYDGPCQNIHGHSYRLFVTVRGKPIADKTNPKLGMVMDFGDLKRIVKEEIIDQLDHAIILNKASVEDETLLQHPMFQRHIVVEYQPTCENLLVDFARRIEKRLPDEVELFSLKLHETATSFAEWFASDQ